MKLNIENKAPQSPVHIIWGGMIIFGLFGVRAMRDFLPLMPPCIFRRLTGIPCLTCGGTHCASALSQLDMTAAFLANPLIMISLVALVLFSLMQLSGMLLKKRLQITLSPFEKQGIRIFAIFLVAANWVYLIIKMK
jgi:hypothetical protein